jgi:hypothetical protein
MDKHKQEFASDKDFCERKLKEAKDNLQRFPER